MKSIIVLLLTVAIFIVNCKVSSTHTQASRTVTLPLAEAAYEIGPETSAKACNYELGWFTREGSKQKGEIIQMSGLDWALSIVTYSLYYWIAIKEQPTSYTLEGAAIHRALKKTDGDILLDTKSTVQSDGFFFPDVCVTVSGKAATLTGPSGHTGRLKK
ncbi:hypothetical protein LEP1GSC195_2646 [Leptospira wolbachii serovar Codice str. CDC]|uniref:Uncharacterized protein n=1 Tax=Leptospira wolbachii serovar Codice str. CDC TaxID=1218599 RepID=R9A446_9LEPT|nr:hypothetical protein [Leptospira wolbachii]EOQ96981.1 hypothetical protein LEP1GSC195_2646 [Leptospira wolbachii serovar Codice str. CDC]